jgi:hypothetical protein
VPDDLVAGTVADELVAGTKEDELVDNTGAQETKSNKAVVKMVATSRVSCISLMAEGVCLSGSKQLNRAVNNIEDVLSKTFIYGTSLF